MHIDQLLAALCPECDIAIVESIDGRVGYLLSCRRGHACYYCVAARDALASRARAHAN